MNRERVVGSTETGGKSRAVVVGASMAGLVAARGLASSFDEVVVLDRDPTSTDSASADTARRGAPQGNHPHLLMAAGQQIVERQFPGFFSALRDEGIESLDWGNDIAWYQLGAWKVRFDSGFRCYALSRPDLERRIRLRLASDASNVRIETGTSVTGYRFSEDKRLVVGVELKQRSRGARTLDSSTLDADLVVDASGAGSRTRQWLEAAGLGVVKKETKVLELVYTTAVFEPPEGREFGWKGIIVSPQPGASRGGMILPRADGAWQVALHGYGGEQAPNDVNGFLDFAASLADPSLARALSSARLLSAPLTFRIPEQRRLRYDHLEQFPAGLAVLGDALNRVDPAFAHGMSLALLQAEKLAVLVKRARRWRRDPAYVTPQFQRSAFRFSRTPWDMTLGKKAFVGALGVFRYGYRKQVRAASSQAPVVHRAFLRMMHLMASPATLWEPSVVTAVVFGAIADRLRKHGRLKQRPVSDSSVRVYVANG